LPLYHVRLLQFGCRKHHSSKRRPYGCRDRFMTPWRGYATVKPSAAPLLLSGAAHIEALALQQPPWSRRTRTGALV